MYGFYLIGLLLAIGVGSYAAYWSFGLRRSLRVKAYARQALMAGSFSIYGTLLYFLFYLTFFLAPSLYNTPLHTVQDGLYVILAPLTFAWVDSSIRVGRRSDPLLRDPLSWSKLRMVLWPLLLLGLVGYFIQGETSDIALLSYVVVGVSIIPILMSAKRSGDPHYRRSLEWFGLTLATLVFQNVGFDVLVPGLGTGILYSPAALFWSVVANFAVAPIIFYAIYMCARSLVPLNRISA